MISQLCIVFAIVIYLMVMIMIGFNYSKKNANVSDFYLGGRKLGPIVTAMSAEASDMSSYLLMGLPGLAYISGLSDVGWTAIGLAVGTYFNWLIVARRLRLYSQITDSFTLPGFFSKRYNDEKNLLSCVAAIIIVIFFIPYTASGFAACGKLFGTLFNANYHVAMILSAIIIVIYCTMGGFLAVSTTDLIQSITMTVALAIVLVYGIVTAGGVGAVVDTASQLPGYLSLTSIHDMASGTSSPYGPITVLSTLAWGLGYFGMPHILLRFMAVEDDEKIKVSRRIASVWVVISMAVAILIGVVGYAVSSKGLVDTLSTSSESETIIIKLADLMSKNGVFPALIAGIILAGILAATMSTADSQLLAAASSISEDLMQNFFGIKISEKMSIIIARVTVIIISVIAVFIANDPNSSIFSIVSFAWAGFGATFGPVMLLALFSKRSNKQGAIAGMISGGVVVFVWKYCVRPIGPSFNIYELLPAFIVALVVNVVVSMVTKEPDEEVVKTFEKYTEVVNSHK